MAAVTKAIRWSVEIAAGEFDIDRKTLSKRIRSAGIEPEPDGKFSTKQISRAVFGDYEGERIRETKERADKLSLENQKQRKQLAETPTVVLFCNGIGVILRQKILSSSLNEDEKDELLAEIKKFLDAGTVTEQVCATRG